MSYRTFPEIRERREPAPDHVEFIVYSPELARAVPGQFAHLLTPGRLRRPLSFSRIDGRHHLVGLMFQIVGSGTRWLSQRRVGERLDALGPLGRGFLPPDRARPWCLVGGGVGIPPLYAAVEQWQHPAATVILGARRAPWVLMADDFRSLGIEPTVTTDDGSLGERGTVAGPLERWLEANPEGQVYACGPTPMLARVAQLAARPGQAQLALEQRMGCGIGACLACVVPARGPDGPRYRRVCSEGPVFLAEELMFE